MAFFASPAKEWLIKKLQVRNQRKVEKVVEGEESGTQLLGLPSNPGEDVLEAVKSVRLVCFCTFLCSVRI